MTRRDRRAFLRDAGAAAAAAGLPLSTAAWAADPAGALAAAGLCPHPNPVVHENRCTDPATFGEGFQVASNWSLVTGYARRPSVDVGEPMELVISGPNLWLARPGEPPAESVEVEVYRLGYYDGAGGRRVWRTPAPVSTFQKVDAQGRPSNDGQRRPPRPVDEGTGLSGRADDRTVVTVPGSALTTTGVYLAKLRGRWLEFPPGAAAVEQHGEAQIVFVVRDDARPRDLLVQLPTNTWQAYNYDGSRSLYTVYSRFGHAGDTLAATGTERAAKVSLDRPYNNWAGETNWVLRTEFPAIWWLERHGYDVAYTDDTALHFAPEQALPGRSRGLVILGHGEYWSRQIRDGVEAARDAGTSIFNLGANTGYWRVRYETTAGKPATSLADARVLVCFKTIEGGGAAGLEVAGQEDPVEPTTTWRDPGKGPGVAMPGTTAATPARYAGNDRPERTLFGVQYIGDDDMTSRGLSVPPDNGRGEFAGHRAWRHTTMPGATGATIGDDLVGWEWDGVPATGQPFAGAAPATRPATGGVRRLSQTDPRAAAPPGAVVEYLMDGGRRYSARARTGAEPPTGWSPMAHAVTYTAPSGALVFSAGTIHWSWGLGPHYLDRNGEDTYASPRVDTSKPAIAQATANLLADAAIYPLTPDGLIFDPHEPPPTTPAGTTPATTPAATTPKPTTPGVTTPAATTPAATTPTPTTPASTPAATTPPSTPKPTTPASTPAATTPVGTTPKPTTPSTTPRPTTPATTPAATTPKTTPLATTPPRTTPSATSPPTTPATTTPAATTPAATTPPPGGESGQVPEAERPAGNPSPGPTPPRQEIQVTPGTGSPIPPPAAGTGPAAAPAITMALIRATPSSLGILGLRIRTKQPPAVPIKGTVELTVGNDQIARATFVLDGTTTIVKLRLTNAARRQLRRKGGLRPLARVTITSAANRPTIRARLTVTART